MDKKYVRMFWPEHHDVEEKRIKKVAREFINAFKLLEMYIPMDSLSHSRESLQFYSSLYKEMGPMLTEITCYIICHNGYERRVRIKKTIENAQKVLGYLKILHERYIISLISNDYLGDERWFSISPLTCEQVVEEIGKCFREMYSTRR